MGPALLCEDLRPNSIEEQVEWDDRHDRRVARKNDAHRRVAARQIRAPIESGSWRA